MQQEVIFLPQMISELLLYVFLPMCVYSIFIDTYKQKNKRSWLLFFREASFLKKTSFFYYLKNKLFDLSHICYSIPIKLHSKKIHYFTAFFTIILSVVYVIHQPVHPAIFSNKNFEKVYNKAIILQWFIKTSKKQYIIINS